ncbi:Dabb family protein [Neomegalonema sp.]|uniref:Dabb family protein n=1 Tax=Neomegalonema sp. TaxID=2039713 RepID=UPI00262C0831|nr:Dabb family protein [Neomegalonema sp.]MDD2869414.1 Dabb family protein [Neomegalonema sp.]
MIRHIVFFSAKDPAEAQRIRDELRARLGVIPHSDHFEVELNAKRDGYANDIDVVVYAEFADFQALAAYKADPRYSACTAVVKPLRELRFAVDYEAARIRA